VPRRSRYFEGRFGADYSAAQAIAKQVLLSNEDLLVQFGRFYLVEAVGGLPTALPRINM
jgi:hypothetical protein